MVKLKAFLKEFVIAVIVCSVFVAGLWYGLISSPLYGGMP